MLDKGFWADFAQVASQFGLFLALDRERAMGMAAVASTSKIAQTMISSSNVMPACARA